MDMEIGRTMGAAPPQMVMLGSGLPWRTYRARGFVWRAGAAGVLLLLVDIVAAATTRQRNPGEYASVDVPAMLAMGYVSMAFIYCLWYASTPQGRIVWQILFAPPICYMTLYTLLCFASFAWSENGLYTGYRSFECLAHLVLVAAVVLNLRRSCTDQEMIDWVVLWGIWTLVWHVVARARLVGLDHLVSWEVFRSAYLALGPLFFLAAFASTRKAASLITVVFCLLSTANSTYFGIFFGALPGLVAGSRRIRLVLCGLAGICVLAVLVFGGTQVIQHTLFYGKEGVGFEHTTGRDRIWTYGIERAMERPLFGYGFVTGEKDLLNEAKWGGVISFHNVFVSSWVGVGILGPVLMTCLFVSLMVRILRNPRGRGFRHAALGSLIMVFFISSTGPGLGGRVYGGWTSCVFILLLTSALAMAEEPQRQGYPGPVRCVGLPCGGMR